MEGVTLVLLTSRTENRMQNLPFFGLTGGHEVVSQPHVTKPQSLCCSDPQITAVARDAQGPQQKHAPKLHPLWLILPFSALSHAPLTLDPVMAPGYLAFALGPGLRNKGSRRKASSRSLILLGKVTLGRRQAAFGTSPLPLI